MKDLVQTVVIFDTLPELTHIVTLKMKLIDIDIRAD